MSGFLNYAAIARMCKNMSSKALGDEPWLSAEIEFVRLEEACCYLVNEWLRNQQAFAAIRGVGFLECSRNLTEFILTVQGLQNAGLWGIGAVGGGGDYGGGGASTPIDEDDGRDIPWWLPGGGAGPLPVDQLPDEEE